MSLHVAKIAAMHAKTMVATNLLLAEKCSLQHAQHVARKPKFLLSLEKIDLFIAVSAFQNKGNFC